jgi:uncharacterized protein (DUF58 family)
MILTTDLMKKIRHIEIRTRRLVNDSFAGEYHSIFKGRGVTFDEVREYIPGDEIRTIDWNVTARMGGNAYVKRYVEERELTVMLMVDASASGDFGTVKRFKRELAAELAAVLSFAATTNNDRVGLMIFSDEIELLIPPRKGRKHVLRIIRELLAYEPKDRGTDLKLALDAVSRILKQRSILFLVSDFMTELEPHQALLNRVNLRHDIIAIDLHDPMEHSIAQSGLLLLEDAETGEMMWVDTNNKFWREQFAEDAAQFEQSKKSVFNSAGIDCIPVNTADDYLDVLNLFFRKRSQRIRRG